MKDTLGTLRARIAALGDTWTDAQGTVHERPTAWAYAQACAALDRWRQRAEAAETRAEQLNGDRHAAEEDAFEWRQRAEVAEAALRQIADNAEASYWELRHWLDSGPDCREWVHGDDAISRESNGESSEDLHDDGAFGFFDGDEDESFDCGMDRHGGCGKAGSEECEFECPFNG